MLKWLCRLLGLGSDKKESKGVKYYRDRFGELGQTDKIEDLYFELAEYWFKLDLKLITHIETRWLMSREIAVDHDCVETIIKTFEMINDLIKVEDWDELHRVSGMVHKEPSNVSLEYYFSLKGGYPIPINEALNKLKSVMVDHYDLLLEIDNLNRLWSLTGIYNDLLALTKSIVFDMTETESGIN